MRRGAIVRGKILAAAGLRFEIRPSQINERASRGQVRGLDAAAVARHLARAKADAVAASLPGRLVLGRRPDAGAGANASANQPIGPRPPSNCGLAWPTHELHSALALIRDKETVFACVDTARLTMRNFSDRFLDDYLEMAGDTALTSVGGYQLEGIGIHLFERVEGDYFTILGLPILPLLGFLRQNKFIDG